MTGSPVLTTIFAHKSPQHPSRTVFCGVSQSVSGAPIGDFIRVRFDFDDDGARRETALRLGKLLLPSPEGRRHCVLREFESTLIVGFAPDQDGDDNIGLHVDWLLRADGEPGIEFGIVPALLNESKGCIQ